MEFINRGLIRNAAGKAFQAWKALLASLLRLEFNELLKIVKSGDERSWLVTRLSQEYSPVG